MEIPVIYPAHIHRAISEGTCMHIQLRVGHDSQYTGIWHFATYYGIQLPFFAQMDPLDNSIGMLKPRFGVSLSTGIHSSQDFPPFHPLILVVSQGRNVYRLSLNIDTSCSSWIPLYVDTHGAV